MFVALSILCVVASVFAPAPPGGVKEVDPTDPNAQAATDFAVAEISAQSKAVNPYVRTSFEGTQQVVSGLKYDLTIKVAESSTCSKTDELSLDLCTVDMTTIHYFHAIVFWQSWKSPAYTLSEFNEVPPSDEEAKFQSFLSGNTRTYTNDVKQYEMKLMTFQDNLKIIQQLQANEQGTAEYGINEFSDISAQEFLSTRAMANGFPESDVELPMAPKLSTNIPTSVDWREKNVVTPVKNQGSCGSCWAFSVTGNIEGQWAIHKGKLISLSEQELVDCDKIDQGCQGGLPWNAFKQIMALGGLETESDYPYKAADGMCHFEKSKVVVNINGSLNISSDEDQMAAWLASNGPITIGINAAAMQHYHGGIADPWTIFCRPSQIDHGVLIVGYGQDGSKPFWIIKNSWGTSWGEKGYYRIIRGKGKCGLNRMPTSATVA